MARKGDFIDLTGQKFNKLTVIEKAGKKGATTTWYCQCECGNKVIVTITRLRTGHTKTCGCGKAQRIGELNKTHCASKTLEFGTWARMIYRCKNSKDLKFADYGGRGISVCDRWMGKGGFKNFLEDMGKKPAKGYSIERINVNGNYEPSNCKWVTMEDQQRNKRNTIRVKVKGKLMRLVEACNLLGVEVDKVRSAKRYSGDSYQHEFDRAANIFQFINHSFGYIN